MEEPPFRFLKKLKIKNMIAREFLAEFWGTFTLIIFGDAAFAQTVLEGKGVADVFAVTWAWGVGVILGIAVSGGISGGHINPAVTVAFATVGKFPWKKVAHYVIAQHLGAFVASAVLFATYYDALNAFDPQRTVIGVNRTALIWATYPQHFATLSTCFVDQIVGTGLLMFTAMATIDKKNMDIPKYLHPIVLGFMISALAMCFGLNCMAPLNPARDFATRAFTALAGWGAETFTHKQYWWIGLVGPHLGAIVGAWLYYLSIELHWPEDKKQDKEPYEVTLALTANDRKGEL